MALEDIVAAMLAEGVTVQEFLHFFTALGLGTHPFIVDVTQQLLYNEFLIHPGTPVPEWTEEEADTLLDVLKFPEPNKVAQTDEFEPWSPGFEKDVLNTETYSRSQAAGPKYDDFEPWSPAFEAAVLEHEDMVTASLACIKDGDFRSRSIWTTMMQLILFFLIPLILQTGKVTGSTEAVACYKYTYRFNGTCHPCPTNCEKCESVTNCTECKYGFHGPVCENTCGDGCTSAICHKVYGHCIYGCIDGFFSTKDNRVCQQCPDQCLVCDSFSHCFKCRNGQFGVTCQQSCPEHCTQCDKYTGQCLQCKESYHLIHGQCMSCPYGCKLCLSDTYCTQCQESFHLLHGKCKRCPYGCRLCTSDDNCTQCQEPFYLLHRNCKRCPYGCRLCASDAVCTKCQEPFYLQHGKCKSCPHGCRLCTSDAACIQCKDSYFLDLKQCKSCPYGCRVCNMTKNCLKCEDEFHGPINSRCLFKCPSNSVITHYVPDKNGRCGFLQDTDRQDTDNKICDGQAESYVCTSRGHCLQGTDKKTSCTTVMSYECEQKCQKIKFHFVCNVVFSVQEVDREHFSPKCITKDVLIINGLTFKNVDDIRCNQQQGTPHNTTETLSTANLFSIIVLVIVLVMVLVNVILMPVLILIKVQKYKNRMDRDEGTTLLPTTTNGTNNHNAPD